MNLQSRIAEPLINDPAADEELRTRVGLSLCRIGVPSISRLEISANSGVVTLRGVVPKYYFRQLAVEGTKQVAGVRQLIDEIRVESEASESAGGSVRRPK